MADQEPRDKTRAQIDANLKRVFEEQLDPELPDNLKALLDQLRAQDGDQGQGTSNE